ncbi:MAG: hypothetical protein HC835_16285 [Oscillatoriales cyanobacterium RM2_1_1]|nr:hypothetical protein [Oscillatoriales cyanobacterium RM2_1_1]
MAVQLKQFQLKSKFVDQAMTWLNWMAGTLIVGSFLLWTMPPIFLSYEVVSHRWIQGFCLGAAIFGSLIALGIGYKLRSLERVWPSELNSANLPTPPICGILSGFPVPGFPGILAKSDGGGDRHGS